MSMPVRHLPVVQNWDCHSCGNCCRETQVPVSADERQRILAQGWGNDPALAGQPLVVRRGWTGSGYRLQQRPDGTCVFLSEKNRCRIHERFGADAKPLACRLFPFVLAPAGDHWRVGLRFACPSAADNRGRPLTAHEEELTEHARRVEAYEHADARTLPPPPLQPGQRVEWPDLVRFVMPLLALLRDRRDRLERRLRKCLALAALCRQATFDKVTGGRLVDFLNVVCGGLDAEAPAAAQVPRPGGVGRLLFRQLLAIYCRKDHGEHRGAATHSRLALLRAGWRFALGRGPVPRVNNRLGPVTFADVEANTAPLPAAAEEVLERYLVVKVGSLQFCGPTNFGLSFWDGLEALAVTFPAALWLARAIPTHPREAAVAQALNLVDDHFGYNALLGTRRLRFVHRTLARRGDLPRLVAWYGK
jgi:lysine-N-methylase